MSDSDVVPFRPPSAPPPVAPELEALARHLAVAIATETCAEHRRSVADFKRHTDGQFDRLGADLRAMEGRLERRLEELEARVNRQIQELSARVEAQGLEIRDHGERLGRIEVRLESGDQKFDAMDSRLIAAERSGKPTVIQIASDWGVKAGVGAAAAAAIVKMLGG